MIDSLANHSTPILERPHFIVRNMGLSDYQATWQAMKDFTHARTAQTCDEIWLLQHPAVFTQGIAGKPEHLLHSHGIELIKTDRGGQITYHGTGQIIAYLLLDIRRLKLGVRELVRSMENAVIDLLQDYRIIAVGRIEARMSAMQKLLLGLKIKKILLPRYRAQCGYGFNNYFPTSIHVIRIAVTQTKDLGITDELKF